MSGWAQVKGSYGASVDDARDKLEYDLYYVKHRSLAFDVLILLRTVRVVLLREGAR
jgi:lipopolysaccharide/colanic/teichoic acid biosynthesis glycosyltransferase